MSYTARYDKGNWKAICDVCGRLYKAGMLQKRWDGLMCCDDDWEIRQPQDFVKGQADHQIAPWLRDESTNNFLPITITQFVKAYAQATTSLVALVIYAFNHMYFTSKVTASLIYVKKILIVAPNTINGSTINSTTLG